MQDSSPLIMRMRIPAPVTKCTCTKHLPSNPQLRRTAPKDSRDPSLRSIAPRIDLQTLLSYRQMLLFAQATPSWTVDAPRIKVPSGRHLAYELVGDRRKRNAILWFHGVLSSRSNSDIVWRCTNQHRLFAKVRSHRLPSPGGRHVLRDSSCWRSWTPSQWE